MNNADLGRMRDTLNHERSLLPSEQRALLDAVEGLKAQVAQAAAHADSFRKHIELVQDSARRGWDKVREAEAQGAILRKAGEKLFVRHGLESPSTISCEDCIAWVLATQPEAGRALLARLEKAEARVKELEKNK